jgi:hypothetical protein
VYALKMLTYVNIAAILLKTNNEMTRKKHPNKNIEDAIKDAELMGWRYKESGGSAHMGQVIMPTGHA